MARQLWQYEGESCRQILKLKCSYEAGDGVPFATV